MTGRRSSLLTISALGAIISLVGGAGLFAALTDTATTGTNSVDSAALASSADIQLATASSGTGGAFACGAFSENLATEFFSATGVTAGYSNSFYFCIKNVGSQAVSVTAVADQLVDVDFACTGDEAASGDATCGGDLLGELSSVLRVGIIPVNCSTIAGSGTTKTLPEATATPFALGTVTVGSTGCFIATVDYAGPTVTAAAVQLAQSDRSTWRFRFDAAS